MTNFGAALECSINGQEGVRWLKFDQTEVFEGLFYHKLLSPAVKCEFMSLPDGKNFQNRKRACDDRMIGTQIDRHTFATRCCGETI